MSTTALTRTRRAAGWRSSRWITLIFTAFGLFAAWLLLNLIINGQCQDKCVIDTLTQTLRVATPIALAAFCGVMCERAGVVDIGIEGKMLMAAMVAYAVNLFSYQSFLTTMAPAAAGSVSRWLALGAALVFSVVLALLHGIVSIRFKADQIISGTVINILALGVTGYLYRQFLAQNLPPGPGTFPIAKIPGLADLPVIGKILFQQQPLTYIMLILAFVI